MTVVRWKLHTGDELVPGRRVQKLLGGGKRYQAFLTWNEHLLCPTVVKILRPDMVDLDAARRTITNEARALKRLDHPSFIRLLAADVEGERPFIELEFLDGPRLSTLLKRHGVLVPEQLFPLARQLAAALHYMHGEGLVHLDVKPRNVIMGPLPRLIDLSISRRIDRLSKIRAPIGTDAYMAPEQCDPARFALIGPPSDVWGLGVTLYESASKRLPFARGKHASTGAERWPQLDADPAPPPAKVRQPLAQLILSCLAREPSDRPTTLEVFEAFDELAAKHGVPRVRLGLR
jgi:serine/threonine protein kinase